MKDRNALIGTIVACTVTLLVATGGMWANTNSRIDAVELRLRDEIRGESDSLDARFSSQIDSLDARLSSRIDSLDARLSSRIDRLADQVNETNERLSRIEGFLQGEFEFPSGRDEA